MHPGSWLIPIFVIGSAEIADASPRAGLLLPQPANAASQAFEVATVKQNAQGFIDIGGGSRLLSGQTRCHGSDFRPLPGDPLPVPPLGRCLSRNSTLKELMNVAYG